MNASTGSRKEIRSLTGLRGLAAVWVMVLHTEFVEKPWNLPRVVVDHGYLAVDLFLVLSGYVMALNYGRSFQNGIAWPVVLGFLRRRFARTYPLYFVMTCIIFALNYWHALIVWPAKGQVCNSSTLIPNLLLVQSWATHFCSLDPPSWSISAEWGAYLLFPLLCGVFLFGSKTRLLASAILAFSVLVVLGMLPTAWLAEPGYRFGPLNISNTVTIAPALRCLAEFAIGLTIYRVSQSELVTRTAARGWPSLVVGGSILVLLCVRGGDVAIVLLFGVLILTLTSDKGILAAALGCTAVYFLGEISYSIYMIHYPIFMMTQETLARLPHAYREYAIDLTVWISTMVLSTATYFVIERPARRLLSWAQPWPLRLRPWVGN